MEEVSLSFARLIHRTVGWFTGRSIGDIVHPDDSIALTDLQPPEGEGVARLRRRLVAADGSLVDSWLLAAPVAADGHTARYVIHVEDLAHAELELLTHAASHDALTGLPNRRSLIDRVTHELSRVRRRGLRCAVLMMDLDHFKVINDSLGHPTGDRVLQVVASRLDQCLRPSDTVARLGGDEFVILLEGLDPEDWQRETQVVCERVLSELQAPVELEGRAVVVSASIGVACGHPTATADEVMRDADAALSAAKRRARGGWLVYDDDLGARARERLEQEGTLRTALSNDDVLVHYQPIFDLTTKHIMAVEALARLRHGGGIVPPSSFLEVAEETGLVVPLSERVITQAAAQVAAWRASAPELSNLDLCVNVSGQHIGRPAFSDWLCRTITAANLPLNAIVVELTEGILIRATRTVAETISTLRASGVRIALDDFGTGYSSMAYLRRLSVDWLKVDREFASGAGSDRRSAALLRSFVDLGSALDLSVVIEGIETDLELALAVEVGYSLGQGYGLCRPLDAGDVPAAARAAAARAVSAATSATRE